MVMWEDNALSPICPAAFIPLNKLEIVAATSHTYERRNFGVGLCVRWALAVLHAQWCFLIGMIFIWSDFLK